MNVFIKFIINQLWILFKCVHMVAYESVNFLQFSMISKYIQIFFKISYKFHKKTSFALCKYEVFAAKGMYSVIQIFECTQCMWQFC